MRKTFQYHSATISYTVQGKGTPVVLLHGFGEDSSIWDQQVLFLKEHCLLIVPDLPGTGESDLLKQEDVSRESSGVSESTVIPNTRDSRLTTHDNTGIEDYADCIHSLLQHEHIFSCILLGHSMGGYITLAFAEKYPSLLTRFGLIHSTAFADSEEKKKNRKKGIALIEEYGPFPFLKNTIPNLFGAKFKQLYPEKVNSLIEAAAAFSKESLQQYYHAMMLRPDRTHVLLSNPLPVLFVMGTEDVAAPMEDVLKQVSLPNISYIHVLSHIGHMGMWEATEQMNGYMLAFIKY